jgi:2-polyprenyl-3-methyl-5-hydroxy-6-metoxy-1,4-benzoquinol methylase
MPNLQQRSYEKELLDRGDIPFADIKQNMKELNVVNSLLGGHQITIDGIKNLLTTSGGGKPISICEIGCGGGDNLYAISRYCKKNNIEASYTGIDIKKECIEYARQQYPTLNANWITSDYALADLSSNKPAIIFSSLFCHHFSEEELINMTRWMATNSADGFFINDLQRHPMAYYSIKFLTSVFSKSYLVKNDAPLSVARGFRKNEWESILEAAAIQQYSIEWKWAFRYLIVCKNER